MVEDANDGWRHRSSEIVDAAGEALVAARLLSLGIEVARPFSDNGVDLVAYTAGDFGRAVPLQVKTAGSPRIEMQQRWFQVPGLVLVYVWLIDPARFFVFDGVADAEAFLGDSATSASWQSAGGWSITKLGPSHYARLTEFEDAWDKIVRRLDRDP